MHEVQIKKSDTKQRIAYAEVYAPNRLDTDGEFMGVEDIRKACYGFMRALKLDRIDSGHTNTLVEGARVVECFIARKGDPDFIEDSWVVGVHIPGDNDWDKVEKGEWNGFSMEAMVKKEKVDLKFNLPPTISGATFKAEDGHSHSFLVSYAEDGRFLGGETDIVAGHKHLIQRGVVTESAMNHSHRFSHIEGLELTL